MATIEERAQAYRKETEKSVFKSGMDISTMEFEYAYIQGATDQRKIDIEKVYHALENVLSKDILENVKNLMEDKQ